MFCQSKPHGNPTNHGSGSLILLTGEKNYITFFLKLGFTPCKAEQPLQGMELQGKEAQKEESIHEISLEKTNS